MSTVITQILFDEEKKYLNIDEREKIMYSFFSDNYKKACTAFKANAYNFLFRLKRMFDVYIVTNSDTTKVIEKLKHLAQIVKKTSLCGLGQTAPNPVLTTIKYFRDEYEAHVNGRCPAFVCKELIEYEIIPTKCVGCTLCAKNCPTNAISGEVKQAHKIDPSTCVRCGLCIVQCPSQAIRKINAKQPGGND